MVCLYSFQGTTLGVGIIHHYSGSFLLWICLWDIYFRKGDQGEENGHESQVDKGYCWICTEDDTAGDQE